MATPLSEETAQKLLAQGSGNSAAQPQQAGLNAAGANKGLKDLTDGAASLYFGFNRLNSGTDAATAGLAALSKGASAVGLGALGKGLDLFGGALLQQKTNMDKASAELGIGGNNIGLFVRMAGDAGLTTQQFSEVVKRADGSIGGLGITAQQSAVNFSKVQKQIVETGDQLNKMGISAQEQADITAMATMNDAKRDASTKAGQAAIAKSAIDMAMSLDETAKITGQSRQAIMDSIKAEEKKPLAQLAMMQMDEKQRENYEKVQQQVQKLGPGFMSLTTEIATGGVQTKEGLAMLQAMGPEAANKYQAATELMLNAKTDEQKKVAQAQMDEAQAAVQRRMADEEFKRLVKSGSAEQQQAAANLVMGNKAMMSVQSEANKNGGDYAKAIKDQREAVQATQAGLKVDEKTGKATTEADEGQKVAQDLNAMNKAAAIAAGGLSHNFEDVNKKLATTPAYIDAMNAAMKKVSGGATTMKEAEKAPEKIGKGLTEIVSGGKESPTKTTGGASSLPKEGYEPTKKRAGGTLAETGSAVEPEDAVVKIHKGETVLNPDATKAMGKQLSAGSKAPGGVNFSEISKSVSTSISSMSGGGSTETKQIQNDSSKAAEKELAAVREQMQAEKNALREQLKAQMGDGSKLGGNAVAKEMRTGDEGKGIAEKYKAMMEPLQKQIDAGISFETTKKASAIEETKKVVEEQSKITFSGSIKQLEAFKSKEKAEDDFFGGTKKKTDAELADQAAKKDEIFKAAELARSVVGTSIKGLSDDAIQAMLPVSASMDDFYVDMNDNLQSFSNDSATNLQKITDSEKAASAAKNISSVPAATGAKSQASVDDSAVNDWKKWITKGNEFKADAERESAIKSGESIKERLATRQAQVAALEQTASQRELTDKEKHDLEVAQAGVRRANNNLKDNEARMVAIDQLEKQGFTKTVESKKSEVAEVAKVEEAKKATTASAKAAEIADTTKHEEAKKATISAQQIFTSMATIGMTESQKKMFGEFSALSKEDSEKKKQSLSEELTSAQTANKAALAARDAIEEKAELEGRKLTEAEEAQRQSLTNELNASANRIDAAREAQKVLGRSEEDRASQAKMAAFEEQNAKEVAAFKSTQAIKDSAKEQENIQTTALAKTKANVNETLTVNGKVVDPNSAEGKAALGKMEEAKAKMNQVMGGMMPDMTKMADKVADPKYTMDKLKAVDGNKPGAAGFVTEQANKLTGSFGDIIGGKGGMLGDMFNPKIVNKVSNEEFAKLTEKSKAEGAPKPAATTSAPKTTEAAAKKEDTKTTGKPGESEQAKAAAKESNKETPKVKTAEATLKDLNDQLIMLNRHMVELINHSATTSDASSKTAKAAAKSTGRAF